MNERQENQNPEKSRQVELARIKSLLDLYAPADTDALFGRLSSAAKELDRMVAELKPLAAPAYSHDGDFFLSQTHILRLPDGLHFLRSLTDESMGLAFTHGAEAGIQAFVDKTCGDINDAIVELESFKASGDFRYKIPRWK